MNNQHSDLVFKQKIYRWDVYWCSMDQDIKTSASVLIGKPNRPCIVISNDTYNAVSNKVLVLPFCSNNSDIPDKEYIEMREKEGDVLIPMVLNRDETSFLIIEQPRLLSKKMLQGYIGSLDTNGNRELAIKITESVFKYLIDPDVFKDSEIFKSLNRSIIEEGSISKTIDQPVELQHATHIQTSTTRKLEDVDYYSKYLSGEIGLSLLAMYTHSGIRETIDKVLEKEKGTISKSYGVSF